MGALDRLRLWISAPSIVPFPPISGLWTRNNNRVMVCQRAQLELRTNLLAEPWLR